MRMQPSKRLSSFQDSKEPDTNRSVVIVGAGLAGTILGRTLERRGISIQIWDQPSPGAASQVAAGIWCPINFHRLIPGWRVEEAVPKMLAFFGEEERRLGLKFLHPIPYWKPLIEDEQVMHWRRKIEEYPDWLDLREGDDYTNLLNRVCQHWDVRAWGVIKASGWFDVERYLYACREDWVHKGCLHEGFYPEKKLKENPTDGAPPTVVDARGFYAWQELQEKRRHQAYHDEHPPKRSVASMRPAQGELVEFELEGWPEDIMLKKELFIQPLGHNRFRAGATFEWNLLSPVPTVGGRERLNADLQKMLGSWWPKARNLQYKAGIRPSSHDRRPYVGADSSMVNRFVFNGFGAKGVLLAPMMAEELVNAMISRQPLHPEAAVG